MIVAAILLWFASLAVYLCSKQQTLLGKALSKLLGWGVFALLFFFALLFMLGTYDLLTAFFLSISFVMAAWISITLLRGHYQHSLISFSCGGALVSVIVFSLGIL